jgi:hypothetical protein
MNIYINAAQGNTISDSVQSADKYLTTYALDMLETDCEVHVGVHLKCPPYLSDLNQNSN